MAGLLPSLQERGATAASQRIFAFSGAAFLTFSESSISFAESTCDAGLYSSGSSRHHIHRTRYAILSILEIRFAYALNVVDSIVRMSCWGT